MKKILLIVCLFFSLAVSGQGNFFWSHNSGGGYGLLYNHYCATDIKNIANVGFHVPTSSEASTLISYVGGIPVAGGKLKQVGFSKWNSPNTGATNEYKFSAIGSAFRQPSGIFDPLKESFRCWLSDIYFTTKGYGIEILYDTETGNSYAGIDFRQAGLSIRLIKDSTTLTHGQRGTYVGNNGYIYPTICIGTQEWLAINLRETKWRDGSDIPNVTDNTAWSTLTTPAWCVYDNNFKYR